MATDTAPTRSKVERTADAAPARQSRLFGWIIVAAGAVLLLSGAATWLFVQSNLSDEQITVSEDAAAFAGEHVNGPLDAYFQAEIIEEHALDASDGQTYAELERDDPRRETVMTASFLRASLFTSVVSFGVAAMAMGLGVVLVLVGLALTRIASSVKPIAT